MWYQHELALYEIGNTEPIRKWQAKYWINEVVPALNNQFLLVSTKTENQHGSEILAWAIDSAEPLQARNSAGQLLTATLLPSEQGFLVWHSPIDAQPASAQLVFFDKEHPPVAFENLEGVNQGGISFDLHPRFLVTCLSDSRQAWLWSAETGEELYRFHRRDPQRSGFEENDLMNFRIDPQGRFLINWGGNNRGRTGSRLSVWQLDDRKPNEVWRPAFRREIKAYVDLVSLRKDGTYLISTRQEVELFSHARQQTVLRRFRPGAYLSKTYVHPQTGDVCGISPAGELFEWPLKTWNADDLRSELADFQRRTDQRLDPLTGELEGVTSRAERVKTP